MKSINYIMVLAIITFAGLTFQCTSASGDSTGYASDGPAVADSTEVKDTIPLADFYKWTKNWENNGVKYTTKDTLLRYFTMDKVDLQEVLEEKGVEKARFYLGLDMDTIPNQPHLLLVGVDKNEKNMLQYNLGQYVYDFTNPCPIFCSGGNGND